MADQRTSLRFDHREIAVIFSLFIFVSLLMFTVGILVGKGLTQAKYEGALLLDRQRTSPAPVADTPDESSPSTIASAGTSVSTDPVAPIPDAGKAKSDSAGSSKNSSAAISANSIAAGAAPTADNNATSQVAKTEATTAPLQLIPKDSPAATLAGESLREPGSTKEADELLKNPKLRALVENDPVSGPRKRGLASGEPATESGRVDAIPASFASGTFTVQVGSYPTEKDAAERVDSLKKLGFPHAYFSAKQWSDTKETWYRVWLGFYPDYESAKRSGRVLQQRGEVTNYLVRKSDSTR